MIRPLAFAPPPQQPARSSDSFLGWKRDALSRFVRIVKSKNHSAFLACAILAGFTAGTNSRAELPMIEEQPWIGYYAAFANKNYDFGVTSQGNIEIRPMRNKTTPVGKKLCIKVDAGIEEILPDGSRVMKKINVDTLESEQGATDKLEKTSIRGKVTGDAEFELNLEQSRGIIFIGGRVMDPGKLTKNPVRFAVRVSIPNAYPDEEDSKTGKSFLKKIKDDLLEVKWTDGKRAKQDFEKAVDATSKELNGPGISSAEITIGCYNGKRLMFTASPNSAITLRNPQTRPLHEGFVIQWTADTTKDPDGKARLAMEVK